MCFLRMKHNSFKALRAIKRDGSIHCSPIGCVLSPSKLFFCGYKNIVKTEVTEPVLDLYHNFNYRVIDLWDCVKWCIREKTTLWTRYFCKILLYHWWSNVTFWERIYIYCDLENFKLEKSKFCSRWIATPSICSHKKATWGINLKISWQCGSKR